MGAVVREDDMAHYSKVATQFQASIRQGALFRVRDYPEHLPLRGQTLTVCEVLRITANPDDYLYRVKDDEGNYHEIRSHWLRRCCERVD